MTWTATANLRPDGAYDVSATYTDTTLIPPQYFSYSETLQSNDSGNFVSHALAALTEYQALSKSNNSFAASLTNALNGA